MINDEQEYEAVEPFEVLPELSADPASYDETPPAEAEYYAPNDGDNVEYGEYTPEEEEEEADAESRLNLVRDIPLTVNVELGRARKEINEILGFDIGTVIVLDKLAGDPVEIYANGKLIARGEVVVIDESYGVRITEIAQS
jgi:flagellar motor switch protein FliN/FliY